MKAIIQHEGKTFSVNLNEAIDISIPMVGRLTNVNAWYATHPVIEPVVDEDFVISVTNGFQLILIELNSFLMHMALTRNVLVI